MVAFAANVSSLCFLRRQIERTVEGLIRGDYDCGLHLEISNILRPVED
jgi:hypothetical protein